MAAAVEFDSVGWHSKWESTTTTCELGIHNRRSSNYTFNGEIPRALPKWDVLNLSLIMWVRKVCSFVNLCRWVEYRLSRVLCFCGKLVISPARVSLRYWRSCTPSRAVCNDLASAKSMPAPTETRASFSNRRKEEIYGDDLRAESSTNRWKMKIVKTHSRTWTKWQAKSPRFSFSLWSITFYKLKYDKAEKIRPFSSQSLSPHWIQGRSPAVHRSFAQHPTSAANTLPKAIRAFLSRWKSE